MALANAGWPLEGDDLPLPGQGAVEQPLQLGQFRGAADQRQLVLCTLERLALLAADDLGHRNRLRAALDGDQPQLAKLEPLLGLFGHAAADEDLARRGLAHQPGGHVDLVAHDAVGEARAARADARATLTGPHAPAADADLHVADELQLRRRLAQLQRRGHGPQAVVVVGQRRAEAGVGVAALVADGQLDQEAFLLLYRRLEPADVGIELAAGVFVVVVIDAAELEEQSHGRPQFGQELARRLHPAIDRLERPGFDLLFRQGVGGERRVGRRRGQRGQPAHHGERLPRCRRPPLGHVDHPGQCLGHFLPNDDLTLVGQLLGAGDVVKGAPGQNIDQLDIRVADDEAPRRPGRHGNLDGQMDGGAGGRPDRGEREHGGLHGQGAGHAAPAVVGVEPAGDRVAGEAHDAAAIAV